ncbi:MAG: hypothetical protein ACO3NE_05750, partial [Alphaproteobacteria bacterium]
SSTSPTSIKTQGLSNSSSHTAHTTNLVPLALVGAEKGSLILKNGRLGDLAPTLLALLGVEQPSEMTGVSLI